MSLNLTKVEKTKVLRTIDQDIALCQTWAFHHQAMAITGVTKLRKVTCGTEDVGMRELTDEEKVMDSMDTAQTHIFNMTKLINLKKKLI